VCGPFAARGAQGEEEVAEPSPSLKVHMSKFRNFKLVDLYVDLNLDGLRFWVLDMWMKLGFLALCFFTV